MIRRVGMPLAVMLAACSSDSSKDIDAGDLLRQVQAAEIGYDTACRRRPETPTPRELSRLLRNARPEDIVLFRQPHHVWDEREPSELVIQLRETRQFHLGVSISHVEGICESCSLYEIRY